ncbi:MAG: hypothetical protein CMF25_05240 [Kangiellaceae bacterium]|nr:hypothetical protein [Kangiellaceae bacterium]|tara:strand:+ start:13185 stop:14450 length:1266 start_codon:yes stop_codon:yes gene_type:complete
MTQTLIAAIDPGLTQASGHHAGFAQVLSDTVLSSGKSVRATIFCHKSFSGASLLAARDSNINFESVFSCQFYRKRDAHATFADSIDRISNLANEYTEVLRQLVDTTTTPVILLFHTLDWLHAAALAKALKRTKVLQQRRFRCLVFLMFGYREEGTTQRLAIRRAVNFRVSFRELLSLDKVDAFASDLEISQQYVKLLDWANRIPIHPCFFFDSKQAHRAVNEKCSTSRQASVLLYIGDAKREKGFCALPEVIRALPSIQGGNIRWVVHFTLHSQDRELNEVASRVRDLCSQASGVELIEEFISDNRLHELMAETGGILLNYSAQHYQYKSSGILWLAGLHNVVVGLMEESWLRREAIRLGINRVYIDKAGPKQILQELVNRIRTAEAEPATPTMADYSQAIFSSFGDWLLQQCRMTSSERC